MKIKIKRFNQDGNEAFHKFVMNAKKKFKKDGQKKFNPANNLINNTSLTEEVNGTLEIDTTKKFINAYDYASYISERLGKIDYKKYRWDEGIFNWISAALFHNFFPGVRGGADEKRVILSSLNKSKWRRHFARTLWEIFYVYQEKSLCVLYKETNNYSDELETISKSPIMFSSKGVLEAYADLFFKKTSEGQGKQTYKRGEDADFRSFIDELFQLEINLDIYRMNKDLIIENLDQKFRDRIKNG